MSSDKQLTYYGELPFDLTVNRLGNLCVKNGVQTGPFGSQLHKEDYVSEGTPIITVEHLGDNRITHKNLPRVSDADRERLSKYSLKAGDIVFSRVGSVDRRAIVQENEDGWLFSGRCLRVRPDTQKLDPQWLSHFFGLPTFKSYIRGIAVGATMPSINTKILSDVPICYPSLKVQKTNSRFLTLIENKIALHQKINQTLEQIAQALFKSWFIDFEPVKAKIAVLEAGGSQEEATLAAMTAISGKDADSLAVFERDYPEQYTELKTTAELFPSAMQDSELGKIPEGWELSSLAEKIILIGGGTPKRSEPSYWGGNICWYSVKDAPNDSDIFVIDTVEKITTDGLNKSSTKLLPIGTTIISARGTVGKLALTAVETAMNQSCYGISGGKFSGPCLTYLKVKQCIEALKRNTHGAVFDTITTNTFDTVNVVTANKKINNEFEKLITPLFNAIKINLISNSYLTQIRDTLLPKLLSGEITLPEAEQAVNEAENV